MAGHCPEGRELEYMDNVGTMTLLTREGRDRDVGWEQRLFGREISLFPWVDCLEKLMRDIKTKSIQGMPSGDGASAGTHWRKFSISCEANSKPGLLPTMHGAIAQTIGKPSDPWACLVVESTTESKSVHSGQQVVAVMSSLDKAVAW